MSGPGGVAPARRARAVIVDVLADAFTTTRSRPGRTLATGIAVAIGIATFVTTASVSQAAHRHVDERFAELAPRVVDVRPVAGSADSLELFEDGAVGRLERLGGVTSAVVVEARPPVSVQLAWDDQPPEATTPLLGVDGALLTASRTDVDGAGIGPGDQAARARVALVGRQAARRLGVAASERRPVVWVEGVPFTVVGIIEASDRLGEALDAVVIPRSTALELFGTEVDGAKAVVRVERGWAEHVAEAIPLQLSPDQPERWLVDVARPPADLAAAVSADVRVLAFTIAALAMVLGLLAIGNATMRAVFERMPEIGLRRALGARGRDVMALLVAEAAMAGAAGGLLGVLAAVVVSVGLAWRSGWPLTIAWPAVGAAVVLAVVVGALAGLFPGWRAIRISPSEALRRE